MAEAFTFFWKSRLSQWHRAPFVLGGVAFTHGEQYMMYAKALLFGDHDAAERILAAVDLLQTQPQMGRPGRVLGTRELVVPQTPYIIPYRVRRERLELMAVFHGRRKWPTKM